MKLILLSQALILCCAAVGCSSAPSYVVCRGEAYCTAPLHHEEAMRAAQLKKAWADDGLYVRPTQE